MMTMTTLPRHCLLLYKNQPALLTQGGDKKIEIALADGRSLSVRPKDVTMLHPGPLTQFNQLNEPEGDVETAWELLQGSAATLPELAELAYNAYTPASAWAVWQLLDDRLYFNGTLDEIVAQTPEQVAAEQAARASKAAEEQAWRSFLARLETGGVTGEDGRYLQEVAALALGQNQKSQVLRALNQPETPEAAHALLLRVGYWQAGNNPYPARAGLPTASPDLPIPALLDEARRDLTHLPAFAIDDEGNQDPDDALSWDEGKLWVHVADVAAQVTPDSLLDLEARARGVNLYLPEGTVTMLPPALTEQLGLGLMTPSPALSFCLEVDESGEARLLEVTPSWVAVTRLSYGEVNGRLTDPPFAQLHEIARRAEARRLSNGAIHIDLPEVRVRVAEDDQVVVRPLPRLESQDMVREAMLLCGEAVARYAFAQDIPLPYTVQDPPSEPLPPANTPSEFFARRRLMSPSRPSISPGAHAGLGLGLYVQVTSPLRRYLDLVIHQQLRAYLAGEALLDASDLMDRVGAAEAISGDARRTERLSNRHWTLVYLQQNPGWRGEGIIVEKRGRKDVVLLPELDLEARVTVKGERPLDSPLLLHLQEVDLPNLETFFRAEVS
jgi:exoribonuclease II